MSQDFPQFSSLVLRFKRYSAWLAVMSVFTAVIADIAPAQDDPFAEPGAANAEANANPDPGTSPAETEEAAAAGEAEKKENAAAAPIIPDDPAVIAIIESNPRSPADLIRAAETLAQLDQGELGRGFLKRFLALPDASDEAKAALVRQLSTATFMRISTDKRLHPEGDQVADAVLAGADRYARDPMRIAALIKQLSDASAEVRRRAMRDLIAGREVAISALVAALADPGRKGEHPVVLQALANFGASAQGPLVALLQSNDSELSAMAIAVLGPMADRNSALYLLGPATSPAASQSVRDAASSGLEQAFGAAPSQTEAEAILYRYATEYFTGKRPLGRGPTGQITLWHWDPASRQPVAKQYPEDHATVIVAARLSRDLHDLDPENPVYRRLYLASLLESAVYQQGAGEPLPAGEGTAHDTAASYGADALEQSLAFAIEHGHLRAATAAARLIGEVGDAQLLAGRGTAPRPLVQALQHGDRELKFAAAEAIMKLRPSGAFAGSSYLPDALAYFARSSGEPHALIAHPNLLASQPLAGLMAELGYEPVTATTGQAAVKAAVASPDIELILLSAAIDKPALTEVLQALRSDPRTANVPIAVLLEEHHEEPEQAISEDDPLTIRFPRPLDRQSVEYLAQKLASSAADRFAPADERARQAGLALAYLAELSSRPEVFSLRDIEPVITANLYKPKLVGAAASSLANLGTRTSQRSLLDLANLTAQPIESREAAAEAFAASVERFGIRLTSDEILRQYDIYNASASLDPATQKLLGSILDTLEQKPTNEEQ